MKTIKITILLILIQAAGFAQNIVHYSYDASGNRVNRYIENVQPIAPSQNNKHNNIAEEIKDIISSDSTTLIPKENMDGTTLSEREIKVFPNPVQAKLNVQFNGMANAESCSLQLFDGKGSLYHAQANLQKLTEINMQEAKPGNYFLAIITKEGKRLYWKLVKQ